MLKLNNVELTFTPKKMSVSMIHLSILWTVQRVVKVWMPNKPFNKTNSGRSEGSPAASDHFDQKNLFRVAIFGFLSNPKSDFEPLI